MSKSATKTPPTARDRLLSAAPGVIRRKGYAASTVDDLCAEAGVTKGAFFHHFASKEALAIAAAGRFAELAEGLFAGAPYRQLADPLQRVLGYVDHRIAMLRGPIAEFSCLLGTMVQELHETHPAIRDACEGHLREHLDFLAVDLAAAKKLYTPAANWTPASVAMFIQSTLQGSLIFAKARQRPRVAAEALALLRRSIESLFKESA